MNDGMNSRIRILIVDDTPASISLVLTALEAEGYAVSAAKSGEKALELAELVKPDLILLDILMPGMDGYETCEKLKEIKSTRDIPIIFLSGLTETYDKVKGFRLGAVDYLIKPIEIEELLARVKTHLSINRLEKELVAANQDLEKRVTARTAELSDANAILEEEITERKQAEEAVRKSRDFYLKLFDNFPNPIWRSDTNAKCDYFNKGWLAFTGRSLEQEVGDGWAEGVHPDDFDECVKTYLAAFHARQPFEMEYRLRFHDGTYHWLFDSGKPFSDLDGAFAGYIGSCYDITERKRALEEIRKSEERFRILADYTYDWEYWISPDRAFVYTTPSCVRITGYSVEDFLTDPLLIEHIIYPDDYGLISDHFTRSGEAFDTSSNDFRILTKDGHIRWINHICEPIFDENGIFLGRRITNRDITEKKLAEEALVISEEKYRTLVESIHIGVYQAKADQIGSFIWANQAMITIFGYDSLEEFLRIAVIDLYMHPGERNKFLERLLKDGFVRDYPIQMKKKDGTRIWISVTSHIRYDADGIVQWNEGILEDITSDYLLEELKWTAFSQIERNMEQFTILNDQIRNPLSIILAYISDSDIPERRIIEQQVERIDNLVDQLDRGYLESEKVWLFLRKHQPKIMGDSPMTKNPC